jgi:hypothetical protein
MFMRPYISSQLAAERQRDMLAQAQHHENGQVACEVPPSSGFRRLRARFSLPSRSIVARTHVSRPLTGKAPGPSITGIALLSALSLALVAACGSGGNSNAGASSGQASSTALRAAPSSQIPATPPDVPSRSPCSRSLPYAADIGSAAQGLISGCNNQSGGILKITNISENVLDVTPAPGTTILSQTTYDVPSDPLPTLAGELEVEAQNALVAESTPPAGAVLLAIGGTLTATAFTTPAAVYVGVDHTVSAESFLAAVWASYVMGINSDANPGD